MYTDIYKSRVLFVYRGVDGLDITILKSNQMEVVQATPHRYYPSLISVKDLIQF